MDAEKLYNLFKNDKYIDKTKEAVEKSNYLKKEGYLLSKKCLLTLSKLFLDKKQISESEYLDIRRNINKSLRIFNDKKGDKKGLEELIKTNEMLLNVAPNEYVKEIIKRSMELDKKFILF